jgi:hypothetical protein
LTFFQPFVKVLQLDGTYVGEGAAGVAIMQSGYKNNFFFQVCVSLFTFINSRTGTWSPCASYVLAFFKSLAENVAPTVSHTRLLIIETRGTPSNRSLWWRREGEDLLMAVFIDRMDLRIAWEFSLKVRCSLVAWTVESLVEERTGLELNIDSCIQTVGFLFIVIIW